MIVRCEALEDMRAHARADGLLECCGLLIGLPNRIERIHPARNLRASPTEYLVDPADHFTAIRAARAEGLAVVGAYHSHPRSTAVPSATDLAEASSGDFLYLIVSLQGGPDAGSDVRGYRLRGRNWQEVTLRPVSS